MTTPRIDIERLHQMLDSNSEIWRTLGELELVAEVEAYLDEVGTQDSLAVELIESFPFVFERWADRKRCTRSHKPLDGIG